MATPARVKRILWAVDAFQEVALQEKLTRTLSHLQKETGAEVEPVYVLSPDQLNLKLDYNTPWVENYLPSAEQALAQRVKSVAGVTLLLPRVLVESRYSLGHSVKAITEHALHTGADLIVVGTHGRSGMGRVLLGSFAETLLLHSPIPVVVVNSSPDAKSHGGKPIRNVLFPTDFSDDSLLAFKRFLPFAQATKAQVTLMHAIPRPSEAVIQSGVALLGGGWLPFPHYINEKREEWEGMGAKWVALAATQAVSASFRLIDDTPSVTEAILSLTQANTIDFVAMASQSGPVAAALVGSVVRQVVREINLPVWVYHPHSAIDSANKDAKAIGGVIQHS